MATRHTKKLLAGALTLLALACLWHWFAPTGVGGSTSYVVTDGISMEPRFHAGDLVLVRRQSAYRVGEIVAYRNTMLDTVVLHRIVGRAGGRYVFKGDNNDFKDFEHPAGSQLMGALWLHLPGAGSRLKALRSPGLIGVLGALGTFLLLGAAFAERRRRRRRHTPIAEQIDAPAPDTRWYARAPAIAVLVALMALLPCVAFVFSRPTRALARVTVSYKQSGALSYSAPEPNSPVYPEGGVSTGDPIFTHVVSELGLRFQYLFHSEAANSIRGRATLRAIVTATNGWHTSMRLGHAQPFVGDHAELTAKLDVGSLLALLRRVEAATDVGGSYTLTLVPQVEVRGRVGSVPLATRFFSRAQFSLNRLEIQPASAGGKAGPFSQLSGGSVAGRRYVPLRSLGVPIATARRLVLGAIAILVCVLLAMVKLVRPRAGEETARILRRYGHVIIPVECVWQLPGVAVIDVEEMEALARIAERYDRSILHEEADWGDAFWVSDESGHFRYAVFSPERLAAAEYLYAAQASESVDRTAEWVAAGPAEAVSPEGQQVEELVRDVALNGSWSAQPWAEPL